jgi:hypothetical protein
MQINYTVKNYQFKETSKGKGIIKYHLVDDQGKERVISAIGKLGFQGKIKSVHPIHHREMPLIEVLSKASLNEKIMVDFTEYNQKYPRGSMRTQKIEARTTKIADPYEESLINDLDSIKSHKMRLFKLAGVAVLVFIAYMSARNSFF